MAVTLIVLYLANMTCEGCDGKSTFLKQQMFAVLEQRGLEPSVFVDADPRIRLNLVVEHFQFDDLVNAECRETGLVDVPSNLGLVIIKPEMVHAQDRVELFLTNSLGVKILFLKEFTYIPEEYWKLHGKALADYFELFPHGALLFLLSITAPSKMVLFEHLSASQYKRVFEMQNNGVVPDANFIRDNDDLQAIFTRYFIRGSQSSLRESVCSLEAAKLGLLSMSPDLCPAICWDFTRSFSQRTNDQNKRTFNGVHSPRDREELILDLSVLKRLL